MILFPVSLRLPSVASRALAASWLVGARGDHLSGWSIVLGWCWVGLGFTLWYLATQAPWLRVVGLTHGIWARPHLAREPDELPISQEVVARISSNVVSSS